MLTENLASPVSNNTNQSNETNLTQTDINYKI